MAPIYHELTPPGIRNYCSHCSTQKDAVNKAPRTPSNQQKHERQSTTASENEAPFHESQWLPLLSSSSENVDELKNRLMGCREGIKGLMAPGRQRNFTIREGSDKHRVLWRHQSMVQLLVRQRRIVLSPATPWCQLVVGVTDTLESAKRATPGSFLLPLAAGGISVSMFSCAPPVLMEGVSLQDTKGSSPAGQPTSTSAV